MKKFISENSLALFFTVFFYGGGLLVYYLFKTYETETAIGLTELIIIILAFFAHIFFWFIDWKKEKNLDEKYLQERAKDLEREEKREARRLREREEDIERQEKYREKDRTVRERNARESDERFEKITRESNERFERLIKEMRRSRYKSCGDF